MERHESRLNEVEAFFCEDILKQFFKNNNTKCFKLMIDDKGRRLNKEGLKQFLKEINYNEEKLLEVITKINNEHLYLPDFIIENKEYKKDSSRVLFVEVKKKNKKSDKKFKFSSLNKKQKDGIKELTRHGFKVIIAVIDIPFNRDLASDEVLDYVFKEVIGKENKGTESKRFFDKRAKLRGKHYFVNNLIPILEIKLFPGKHKYKLFE